MSRNKFNQCLTGKKKREILRWQKLQWNQKVKCKICDKIMGRNEIDSSGCRVHIKDNNDLIIVEEIKRPIMRY
jgi:hypothetical protein